MTIEITKEISHLPPPAVPDRGLGVEGVAMTKRFGEFTALDQVSLKVPAATFRHGRVFGAPMGDPAYRYYAEWEWPDLDGFKSAARSEEFMATGKDAMEMGGKFTVMFADVD